MLMRLYFLMMCTKSPLTLKVDKKMDTGQRVNSVTRILGSSILGYL